TFYTHLLVLGPLWLAAPLVLRYLYGTAFLEATQTLRILLVASVVLGTSGIVISGLNGFGHPGLSTIARLSSAAVTVVSLLLLLPRLGIVGAALASLMGYSATLIVALFWLLQRRELSFWSILRPRRADLPAAQ